MNFTQKTLTEKIFLVSAGVAIISLFLPWVDLGFVSVNGFQQQGYLFLAGFAYTVVTIVTNKDRNKLVSLMIAIVTLLAIFAFRSSKTQNLFGKSVNFATTGVYIMILAAIGNLVGAIMEYKNK